MIKLRQLYSFKDQISNLLCNYPILVLIVAISNFCWCIHINTTGVVATTDTAEACKGVNIAVMVGGFPRKEGMERKDVMSKNVSIYNAQASALEKHAAADCKVSNLLLHPWKYVISCFCSLIFYLRTFDITVNRTKIVMV